MALDASDIKRLVLGSMPDAVVTVRDLNGDGKHFAAEVTSFAFVGKSRVEQHKMVYSALGDNMRDALHALALQTNLPKNSAQAAQGDTP